MEELKDVLSNNSAERDEQYLRSLEKFERYLLFRVTDEIEIYREDLIYWGVSKGSEGAGRAC